MPQTNAWKRANLCSIENPGQDCKPPLRINPAKRMTTPKDMLPKLPDDNLRLTSEMQQVHNTCDEHRDVATASLLEVWIDETERRSWVSLRGDASCTRVEWMNTKTDGRF